MIVAADLIGILTPPHRFLAGGLGKHNQSKLYPILYAAAITLSFIVRQHGAVALGDRMRI